MFSTVAEVYIVHLQSIWLQRKHHSTIFPNINYRGRDIITLKKPQAIYKVKTNKP